eukprot:950036-Rhodomonas_salina.1
MTRRWTSWRRTCGTGLEPAQKLACELSVSGDPALWKASQAAWYCASKRARRLAVLLAFFEIVLEEPEKELQAEELWKWVEERLDAVNRDVKAFEKKALRTFAGFPWLAIVNEDRNTVSFAGFNVVRYNKACRSYKLLVKEAVLKPRF